jgi:uncharacterized protein
VTHEELQEALARVDITVDAAEAHGLLCGALCTRDGYGAREWLVELAAEQAARAAPPDAPLRGLPDEVLQAYRSPEFEFEPLLPAEEAPLAERVDALAAWCAGFLYGVGAGAPAPSTALSGEVGEFLRDLAEIARAGLGVGQSAEDGESDYAELFEFVRAGAQLAFDELSAARGHAAG